jgi:hypothetical protein
MHTLFDPTWFAKLLPEREAHLRVLTPGAPPNNLPSGGRRRPERRAGACGLAGRAFTTGGDHLFASRVSSTPVFGMPLTMIKPTAFVTCTVD